MYQEKYKHCKFEIEQINHNQYNYKIYYRDDYLRREECIESEDYYDTKNIAKRAAIDHIVYLESGV